VETWIEDETHPVMHGLWLALLQLAQAFEAQGSHDDARWVLDYGHKHLPEFFEFDEAKKSRFTSTLRPL